MTEARRAKQKRRWAATQRKQARLRQQKKERETANRKARQHKRFGDLGIKQAMRDLGDLPEGVAITQNKDGTMKVQMAEVDEGPEATRQALRDLAESKGWTEKGEDDEEEMQEQSMPVGG